MCVCVYINKCNHIPSMKHGLDYISRICVGFINEVMEAFWKIY